MRFSSRLIFLALSIVPTLVYSQPERDLLRANEAYQNQAYAEAVRIYQQLLDSGYYSEALYHNLGNAYFRMDSLGQAVLNYERGLLLAPRDKALLRNLRVARSRQEDQIERLETFFLRRWWNNLRLWLTESAWSGLGLFLLWSGVAGLLVWLLGARRNQKKWGFFLGVLCLGAAGLALVLGFSRKALEVNSRRAVLLSEKEAFRVAPDTLSRTDRRLHDGVVVDIIDSLGAYYKTRLRNGDEGWIKKEALERI